MHLDGNSTLDHIGIMASTPKMPSSIANRTALGNRSGHFGHMTRLANKAFLLHEIFAFILFIGSTRPSIIKLEWPGHHIMASVTHFGGPKRWIKFSGMGSDGIIKGSINDSIPYVTGGTGDTFLLIIASVM